MTNKNTASLPREISLAQDNISPEGIDRNKPCESCVFYNRKEAGDFYASTHRKIEAQAERKDLATIKVDLEVVKRKALLHFEDKLDFDKRVKKERPDDLTKNGNEQVRLILSTINYLAGQGLLATSNMVDVREEIYATHNDEKHKTIICKNIVIQIAQDEVLIFGDADKFQAYLNKQTPKERK